MASDRQIAANRQNAQMSSGPRSLAGKTRSSQNAVKHGLTAEHAMLPGEDVKQFNELKDAMFQDLQPTGPFENQLVERATSLIWRLRRVPMFEVVLFKWAAHLQAKSFDDTGDDGPDEHPGSPQTIQPISDLQDDLKLGRMIESLLNTDLTSRLGRYETTMQRHLSETVRNLRELQTIRAGLANSSAVEMEFVKDQVALAQALHEDRKRVRSR